MGVSIWQIIILLLILIPTIWIYGRILNKAGYSRWSVLFMFVPFVNLIMIWVFAFAKWPMLEQTGTEEKNRNSPEACENNYSGVGVCKQCGAQAGIFNLKNGICTKCLKQKNTENDSFIGLQQDNDTVATQKVIHTGIGICKQCGANAGIFNLKNGICNQCRIA